MIIKLWKKKAHSEVKRWSIISFLKFLFLQTVWRTVETSPQIVQLLHCSGLVGRQRLCSGQKREMINGDPELFQDRASCWSNPQGISPFAPRTATWSSEFPGSARSPSSKERRTPTLRNGAFCGRRTADLYLGDPFMFTAERSCSSFCMEPKAAVKERCENRK